MGRTRYCSECSSRFVSSLPEADDRTHRSPRDEIGELNDVARVRVDEGLVPHSLTVVPDLDDVCEGDGAVLLRNVLEFGRVPVVFPTELVFSL